MPFDEIHRARSLGILEYCKRSKIPTATNDKGQLILRDRPFVVIDGQFWTNTKNKTQGTLIELVSSIHRCSFVQAIARINDNPRLLLLEEHVGPQQRKYFSFYLPKESQADRPEATKKVERLLRAFGSHSTYSKDLLDKDLAHVSKEGSIRLFPAGDSSGAFEFAEERDGSWSKRKAGTVNSPFLSVKGNGKKAVIFLDPFSAMKTYKEDLFSSRTRRDGLLVLMEPEQSADIGFALFVIFSTVERAGLVEKWIGNRLRRLISSTERSRGH